MSAAVFVVLFYWKYECCSALFDKIANDIICFAFGYDNNVKVRNHFLDLCKILKSIN